MIDGLKQLKFYLSSFHKNNQTHLWFDKEHNTWYFITNIHGDPWTGEIKDTHTIVVKMNITDETFSELFQSIFQPLFKTIDTQLNHYLFDVRLLNRYINKGLKDKELDTTLLDDSCLIYSRQPVSYWLPALLKKYSITEYKTETFLDLYKRNPNLSSLDIQIENKHFRIPIKQGVTFIHSSVMDDLKNVSMEYTIHKFSNHTFTYSYSCTSEENSFIFYQPFRLFV